MTPRFTAGIPVDGEEPLLGSGRGILGVGVEARDYGKLGCVGGVLGRPVAFVKHLAGPGELAHVQRALASGHTAGDGPFTARASELLSAQLGRAAGSVLLTTSCTHALELAALLLRIGPGDEVVMPSFTFSSTANAFALRGASVRFADIDRGTFSMELAQLETALGPRTRAVVTVPYGGVMREMAAIRELCAARAIDLMEDAAHALFATTGSQAFGTFGALGALRFHATKNVSCGEGGAIILNDPFLRERALVLREKGTDRSRFLRGEVDKYTWQDVGSSYLPSDVLAAILVAQLENAETTQRQRHHVWSLYRSALAPRASDRDFGLRGKLVASRGRRLGDEPIWRDFR